MPRPLKPGLDFFQHDTSMSSDEALEALEALYGNDGYAVYNKLLERIYKSNGKLHLSDEITRLTLAKKFNVTTERFDKIIEDAVRFELFDRAAWESEKRLTSHRIQEQLGIVEELREEWRNKKGKEKSGKQGISPGENSNIPGENADYPPGKVHKGEESREENSNNIKREGENISYKEPTPSPSPPQPFQEKSGYGILKNVVLSENEHKELCRLYRESIITDYIDRLGAHLEKSGKTYRSHFAAILDWLNRDHVEQRAIRKPLTQAQSTFEEPSPEAKSAFFKGVKARLKMPSG